MKSLRFLRFAPALLLAACSSMPDISLPDPALSITPYRVDIRQGNFISQEMVVQLKPGMTRDQVRFILGTPLLMDMFHADRWDYIYRFQPGRGETQQRRLAVFFEEGKLARVAGDVVGAAPGEAAAGAAAPAQGRIIEIGPAASDKETLPDKPAPDTQADAK